MEKCLLSIDWDYFIWAPKEHGRSYWENGKNLLTTWYKRYLQLKSGGVNIYKVFRLSPEVGVFWEKIKQYFRWEKGLQAYVSDSHALSYYLAKEHDCQVVYLFDAHADLGYGGLASLEFQVHCGNWLGKLLKEKQVQKAYIFYSPATWEKPEDFREQNSLYPINYLRSWAELKKEIPVSVIHICRSGAWTPPWLDQKFGEFLQGLGLPYKNLDCRPRKWDVSNLSLAQQIDCLLA